MNEDYIKQTNSTQAGLLITSLDSLREQNILCDFDVKVGDKSFRAHRCVLAASSGYFKAMFTSKMKESRDGFINMKDVDQNGISQCIEFMYKGVGNLKMEYVQQILQASNLLQMVGLTNFCFHYLKTHLSSTNCFSVINLAQAYDRHDIKEQAEQVLITNFKSVISSEMFPFIIKPDLLRYIKVSNVSYQTSWQAMITWARAKDEDAERCFADLVTVINIQTYPFKFLLETVLEEPLVKSNDIAKNSVITALFSDVKNLETNLEIDNCFILKNLAETNQATNLNAVKEVMNQFLEANFEQIIEKKEFCDISKDDIIRIYKSPNTKYSSETIKWHGALRWIKHDIQKRKKNFQDLFGLLDLQKFPLQFLEQTIRSETLVRDSRKCYDILMDELFSRARKKSSSMDLSPQQAAPSKTRVETETYQAQQLTVGATSTRDENTETFFGNTASSSHKSRNVQEPQMGAVGGYRSDTSESQSSSQATSSGLRIINQQPPGGEMSVEEWPESLPGCRWRGTLVITYSFPAGSLNGVSYEAKEFTEYLPANPHLKNLLRKAFNAGLLFKIQIIRSDRGEIIWNNEFPHKTNKRGGPGNNGYPDQGHTTKLRKALEAKLKAAGIE
uniref:kelch-like protein 12 n=1 Tax=Styela clava TaxID=7725 RepID=UPI0019398B78|nr:kelch-like protein 12 [Styela clava]